MAENCKHGNFDLKISSKKSVRFKAGAELSSSVNKMEVDVIEELDDKFEMLVVKISLGQQQCEKEI
jgi:hypothetical protein